MVRLTVANGRITYRDGLGESTFVQVVRGREIVEIPYRVDAFWAERVGS